LLSDATIETVLVFAKTKHGADKIARELNKNSIRAEAIHGNKSQNERQRALNNFKNRRIRVLVASDIAARGIDVDDLTHVINFDLPNIPETYVHRIGRTGRAGAAGVAISFCDYEEKISLADIQKLIAKKIPIVKDHPYDVALMHPQQQTVSHASSSFNKRRNPAGGKRYGRVFRQRA
jgi:ATP-dependent RNA helicase RhlE